MLFLIEHTKIQRKFKRSLRFGNLSVRNFVDFRSSECKPLKKKSKIKLKKKFRSIVGRFPVRSLVKKVVRSAF